MNDTTGTTERRDILLIAADFSERRLLYGELLEAGYDVLPLPGIERAIAAMLPHTVEPRLILVEVRADEAATPRSVEYLAGLVPGIPVILIVGSIDRELWQPLEGRIAGLLHRPITIGQIVAAVKRTLKEPRTK